MCGAWSACGLGCVCDGVTSGQLCVLPACYPVAEIEGFPGARYAVWQGTVAMSVAPGVGCTHLVGPLRGVDVQAVVPVKRGGQLTVLRHGWSGGSPPVPHQRRDYEVESA